MKTQVSFFSIDIQLMVMVEVSNFCQAPGPHVNLNSTYESGMKVILTFR